MNTSDIKTLTRGAVTAAVFLMLILLFPINHRLVQSLLLIIYPIPIALFCLSSSKKWCLIVFAACLLLSFILMPPLIALFFAMPGLAIGFVYGTWFKNAGRKLSILLVGCLYLLFTAAEIFAYSYLIGFDIFGFIYDYAFIAADILTGMPIWLLPHGVTQSIILFALLPGFIVLSIVRSAAFIFLTSKLTGIVNIKR